MVWWNPLECLALGGALVAGRALGAGLSERSEDIPHSRVERVRASEGTGYPAVRKRIAQNEPQGVFAPEQR